jgi:ParB family chromosome partitioning protein
MRRQRLAAGIAEAGDDADHARRNAGPLDQLCELQQRGRTVFRRLDHDRIAGSERRPQLQRRKEQLGIPRHDGGDHADRLAHGHHEHVRLVDRQGGALDLVGQAGVVVIELGDVFDLAASLPQQLAGIDGLDLGHGVGVFGDQITEPPDQLAALSRGQLRPRPLSHGAVGSAHGPVDILGSGGREGGPDFAGRGIDALEPRAIAGVDQRAIDQHAVGF